MSQKHILLVEDDDVTAALLGAHLKKDGYVVTRLADGHNLMAEVRRLAPDAVVLDGRLPSADGFDLCRELRPLFSGVIVLLTARDDDLDELLGLELGADDYIRKPASARIVLAHLRACFRRIRAVPPEGAAPPAQILNFANLTIKHPTRTVLVNSREVIMTTAEFDLLWLLAENAGSVLSREDIFRQTRGLDYDGLDRSIDMRISRLRKLIGDDTVNPHMIKTVRGKGYLFAASKS
jgi:DNA-binding response OmpR family regulator